MNIWGFSLLQKEPALLIKPSYKEFKKLNSFDNILVKDILNKEYSIKKYEFNVISKTY